MFPDYYNRLKVRKEATLSEIKKAFRKLALLYHPDKNINPNSHEIFVGINEAYLILADKEARYKYDKEYDFYNNSNSEKDKTYQESEFKKQYYKENFADENLNKWAFQARSQGEEYAKMSFAEFSKILLGYLKETGIVLGKSIISFYGFIIVFVGIFVIILSFSANGEMTLIFPGLLLLFVGIFLIKISFRSTKK